MLYGVEDQRAIATRRDKSLALSSAQHLTTIKSRLAALQPYQSPQTISLIATKLLGKSISVASAQSITSTHPQIVTPVKSPAPRAGGRIMQPGNLQAAPVLHINWQHPIASGLVFFEAFDQLQRSIHPYMPYGIGQHGTLTIAAGTAIRSGPGGLGLSMSANTGGLVVTSGNLVRVPQTAGSYFAYVTADFAPNDGVAHYITSIGKEASSEQFFSLVKWTDNITYFGWFTAGVSYRAAVASTGLWAAGDSFMYGGTWNASNTNCFIKGKLAGSFGSAPTTGNTTTATAVYRVGNGSLNNQAWGTAAGKNFIYYIAMWNRDLSTAECNYLNQNPYCFLTGSERG